MTLNLLFFVIIEQIFATLRLFYKLGLLRKYGKIVYYISACVKLFYKFFPERKKINKI